MAILTFDIFQQIFIFYNRKKKEEEEREKERKREEKIRKKEERRKEREEKRRKKRIEKKRKAEEKAMALKIAMEERKILIAQRKLETIHMLSELFTRIKVTIHVNALKKKTFHLVYLLQNVYRMLCVGANRTLCILFVPKFMFVVYLYFILCLGCKTAGGGTTQGERVRATTSQRSGSRETKEIRVREKETRDRT